MESTESTSGTEALPGERPRREAGIRVLNPRDRTPVSLIIDDSTCLVNLAHFGIPAFAEAWPGQYRQDWRSLPREIPDAFVREFGEWCHEHGVKGKYSIVPYPACVGWVDREMPGWTKQALQESLELVRTLMMPDWDIHPEMISHTWAIDTKTGRPYPERTPRFMENWDWTKGRSVDEMADYLSYALRLLRNVGLPCEGVTTPGGFGDQARPALAQGTLEACRSVFQAEIPHYFRHLFTDDQSVAPRVEYASGLESADPRCVVSVVGCTEDWFGGWDGLEAGSVDAFITADLQAGRMVEVIARGEPAIMVCHWPGIYFNGAKIGFRIFQEVVRRLHARYDSLIWMKLSEISRYWAARELTRIERRENSTRLYAPFAAPDFTVELPAARSTVTLTAHGAVNRLREVDSARDLISGTWHRKGGNAVACFDLPRGESVLQIA